MTRYAPPVELTVKNASETERSISLKVEGLKPDPATTEMVACALGRFFCFGRREVFRGINGAFAAAIVDHEGRRLIVYLPATETAFDGETGKALADAHTWLTGDVDEHFLAVRDVIEIRAILHNKNLPRASKAATRAAMDEFGLARDEAGLATTFRQPWYGRRKEFIRTGKSSV